jgi:hypothetical protein
LKSVVSAHEVIHEVHSKNLSGLPRFQKKKNLSGLILKLDYEKAYDRIDWTFLDHVLESRGFGPIFRGWVKAILHQVSFCVRINDVNNNYFVAGKDLKQ